MAVGRGGQYIQVDPGLHAVVAAWPHLLAL
jgi:hypothetical protein